MAHHIAPSQRPGHEGEIGRLTVAAADTPSGQLRTVRISQAGGGLRVRSETPGGAYIRGEDLFALREMIAEMPEEAFTRPADPVAEVYAVKDIDGDWWATLDDSLEDGFAYVFNARTQKPTNGTPGANRGVALQSLADFGIDPGEPPFWTDGDQIVYTSSYTTSVFERIDEVWHRIFCNDDVLPLGPTPKTDAEARQQVDQTKFNGIGWSVLKRANA